MKFSSVLSDSRKRSLLWVNTIGGILVLGSYVIAANTYSGEISDFWGGVSEDIVPFYTIFIFLAALGYFLFSYYVFFVIKTDKLILNRFSYNVFHVLYGLILIPSALWMPLTAQALTSESGFVILLVRLILIIVGVSSIVLTFILAKSKDKLHRLPHTLAVVGGILFSIQTTLFDAILWSVQFPKGF
jgi:hypothetical protein